jgi:hypothetical protein
MMAALAPDRNIVVKKIAGGRIDVHHHSDRVPPGSGCRDRCLADVKRRTLRDELLGSPR